jgi:hypothetical protein
MVVPLMYTHKTCKHTQTAARPVAAPPPKDERARAKERLHGLYEGGLVVTTPFLRAANAQPLALLGPNGGGAGWEATGEEG